MAHRDHLSGRAAARAVLAAVVLCALAPPAQAEVRIEGDETNLTITVDQASLGEVLGTLKARFRLRHGSLGVERPITGTYSGTLHRVVVRLLDGFDFVVSRSPDGVEIMTVAPRGAASFTPQARRGVTEWRIPSAQAATQSQPPSR
jgi:hypothetical protein